MALNRWKLIRKGKVREIYESADGEFVAIATTDRVSAFDHVLPVEIEGKGEILARLSAFWFEKTKDVTPNAFLDMRKSLFLGGEVKSYVTIMRKLRMLPIEAIVRGYIAGSIWDYYKKGEREFCGISLPDGLVNSSELETPIFTPTTKAPVGEHDNQISFDEMVDLIAREGFESPEYLAEKVRKHSLRLYSAARDYSLDRGVIIADTKFEFGVDAYGDIYLADELLTPDSSRFWLQKEYQPGQDQKSMDKQIIRDYIAGHSGEIMEKIPRNILEETKAQYELCLKMLTAT